MSIIPRIRARLSTIAWVFAWAFSLTAFTVGIVLTRLGDVTVWPLLSSTDGVDTYESQILTVWPAGLVLLAVGGLGTIAVALAMAIVARPVTVVARADESLSVDN